MTIKKKDDKWSVVDKWTVISLVIMLVLCLLILAQLSFAIGVPTESPKYPVPSWASRTVATCEVPRLFGLPLPGFLWTNYAGVEKCQPFVRRGGHRNNNKSVSSVYDNNNMPSYPPPPVVNETIEEPEEPISGAEPPFVPAPVIDTPNPPPVEEPDTRPLCPTGKVRYCSIPPHKIKEVCVCLNH